MYSYEDRIRAVKLFIKLGRRTEATIRLLAKAVCRSVRASTTVGIVERHRRRVPPFRRPTT